jgi:hypothetical protein
VAKIAIGVDDVAHALFQFLRAGKAAVALALPQEFAVDPDFELPPVPGISATSPRLSVKVWSNSCAIQPARSSQLHCVQYRIVIRGFSPIVLISLWL